jgi:copper(I)-binding protein
MKSVIYKSCLGCIAGAALVVTAGQSAVACEAHAYLKPPVAEAQSRQPSGISADNAWVPLAPPGVKAHAAYLVLNNGGGTPRAVTGVDSPQYKSAALHVTQTKDGIAMMQHLAQVDLPPGASVAFKPHGLHVMLMGPKGAQSLGDKVDLIFTLDDGATLAVTADVRKRTSGKTKAPDHMDHGAMGHKGS